MLTGLGRLLKILDEQDHLLGSEMPRSESEDDLWEARENIERKILKAPISSDSDAIAKIQFLARTIGEGERSDGLDITALNGLARWLESRLTCEVQRKAA